jgi:hypothetical protein
LQISEKLQYHCSTTFYFIRIAEMFSIDRKLKLTLGLLLLFSFVITTPAIAGNIVGGTLTIADDTPDEVFPAIAYNSTQDEYLVVWYNNLSTDDEIRGQLLDKHGKKLRSPFYIASSSGHDRRFPDVAYNKQDDEYLVVWENKPNTSPNEIRGQRLDSTGAILNAKEIIIYIGTTNIVPLKPKIAYANTANRYTVVWEEKYTDPGTENVSYRIAAKTLMPNGSDDVSLFFISNGADERYDPDIAYNRQINRHLVVWEEFNSNTSVFDVNGFQVKGDGGTYGSEFPIGFYETNSTNPSVAAIPASPGDIRFMVVYENQTSSSNHEIYADFIEEDGTIAKTIYPATSANSETGPAVAGSEGAQEFLVVWHENTGTDEKTIKARQYSSTGTDLGVIYGFDGPATGNPAVAAGHLGDFLIAWQDTPVGSTNNDIFGSLFGNRVYLPLVLN